MVETVRRTIELPKELDDAVRRRAQALGVSEADVIAGAVEQTFTADDPVHSHLERLLAADSDLLAAAEAAGDEDRAHRLRALVGMWTRRMADQRAGIRREWDKGAREEMYDEILEEPSSRVLP